MGGHQKDIPLRTLYQYVSGQHRLKIYEILIYISRTFVRVRNKTGCRGLGNDERNRFPLRVVMLKS